MENSDYSPPIADIETASLDFDQVKHLANPRLLLDEPNKAMQAEYAKSLAKNLLPATRDKKVQEWVFNYNPEKERAAYMEKAALDPTRSFCCWLAVKQGKEFIHLKAYDEADERELLREAHNLLSAGAIMHYGNKFDLPFLTTRAWLQGVPAIQWRKGRWAKSEFVDTCEELEQGLGDRYRLHAANLDFASKMFGWTLKPMKATDFWQKMNNGEIEECQQYVEHDVITTEKLARKLGLLAMGE